ncbi:MAG: hypothetical protein M3Y77_06885 [Actinomycetota bacterium]|nr:hypothetical protein [Actinomycetota bacterium]
MGEFFKNWSVRAGLAVFAMFILTAAFGPYAIEHMLGYTPLQVDYGLIAAPPSSAHPLGTTNGARTFSPS